MEDNNNQVTKKIDNKQLYTVLKERFISTDLKELCLFLDIDFDDIEGINKQDTIYELIRIADTRLRTEKIIEYIKDKRTDIKNVDQLYSKDDIEASSEEQNETAELNENEEKIGKNSIRNFSIVIVFIVLISFSLISLVSRNNLLAISIELTPTVTPTPNQNTPPINSTPGSSWIRPADEMEMVYVPTGRFMMGSNYAADENAKGDEFPQREITLDEFWIDKYEVTNFQFARFLSLNGNGNQIEAGKTWLEIEDPDVDISLKNDAYRVMDPANNNYPIQNISWYGARAYCEWAGGSLPTEAQWEYAARGNDGRLYPWGNEPPDEIRLNRITSGTTIIGTFPSGNSWIGVSDMSGNLWEWVADWYDKYPDKSETNPTGPPNGEFKVARGGSWNSNWSNLRAAVRKNNADPASRQDLIGFRCIYP